MFGGLRYVLVAPIPFIMTPLILHKIGVGGYGTWAVFLAINGLTSLADLGLVGTVSKFVAEYHARRDFGALARLLNSGLALFLLLAFVIGTALWGLAPWLASLLFRGSTIGHIEVVSLFRFFLIVIAANILTVLFSSVTSGLQRRDLTNMVSAANVFLSALFGGILLLKGWGLRGLVYGYIGSGILTVAAYVVIVRALLPQVVPNPMRFDRTEGRKMFGFSLRLYVTQAAVAVHNQVEKVFLAILVGVGAAGWYDIASDVALKLRGAIGLMLTPVLPAASELSALGDEHRLKELYYRTHKYLALIGVPAVCFVAAPSSRIVSLWLGPNFRMIALPWTVLLLVNFFNLADRFRVPHFCGNRVFNAGYSVGSPGDHCEYCSELRADLQVWFFRRGCGHFDLVDSRLFLLHFRISPSHSLPVRAFAAGELSEANTVFIAGSGRALALSPTKNLSWFGLVIMGLVFGTLYFAGILLSLGSLMLMTGAKLRLSCPSHGTSREGKPLLDSTALNHPSFRESKEFC